MNIGTLSFMKCLCFWDILKVFSGKNSNCSSYIFLVQIRVGSELCYLYFYIFLRCYLCFLSYYRTKDGLKYKIAVVADPDTASKNGDIWITSLQ